MFKSKSLKLIFMVAVVTFATVFSCLGSGVSAASLTNDFNQLNQSQIVSEMGAGWNLGNQLEASIDGMPGEEAWGNNYNQAYGFGLLDRKTLTVTQQEIIDAIRSGMGTDTNNVFIGGDVNGDGKVDALDFAMFKQYLLGKVTVTPEALKVMDINSDCIVDAIDYALLKSKILHPIY